MNGQKKSSIRQNKSIWIIRIGATLLLGLAVFFSLTACKLNDNKLGDKDYVNVRVEINENSEHGFILVIEELVYVTIESEKSKEPYRNKDDNNNPYKAYAYYRYFDIQTNNYVDEFVGRFSYYKVNIGLMNNIFPVIKANEVPSKYELVKGRVI